MYHFDTPLLRVKGIGPALSQAFEHRDLHTVRDLLFFVPLRYEDRSLKKKISELQVNEVVTLEAEVVSTNNFYKGRRSIQSAVVKDDTGKVKLMWFNNPHVLARMTKGSQWLVSGKLNDRGTFLQPTVEIYKEDSIHTGRLVPIYSAIPEVAPATLRRILKHIVDELGDVPDPLENVSDKIFPLTQAICQIHFPEVEDKVIKARERFALEEVLGLIHHSHFLKEKWKSIGEAVTIHSTEVDIQLPFTLTRAQQRCVKEILSDLTHTVPMNRLLIGDVGSGKTAVAGIACLKMLATGHHAALVSPTQILAEQHCATFAKLFPNLRVEMVTARTSKTLTVPTEPTVFIGTHAVLNQLENIHPGLLIYDEQHRFGVEQRSLAQKLTPAPHILTLSATPIPRTLMLTLFSHLQLSVIDELPPGRQPIKTWLVPEEKRSDGYTWIAKQLQENKQQALIVCPFIDPSENEALENVAAATETFEKVKGAFAKTKLKVELLHGRIPKKDQAVITQKLFDRQIDILVTTPIVEVGVDLPAASVIVIEAAERFGLASLHQLRGRVGRAGQEAFCLLFTSSKSGDARQRLKQFCEIHDGLKLAEMDMQRRGAGDLFGTQQHGFDTLQFATWANLELITLANQIYQKIPTQLPKWSPLFAVANQTETIPLAN